MANLCAATELPMLPLYPVGQIYIPHYILQKQFAKQFSSFQYV